MIITPETLGTILQTKFSESETLAIKALILEMQKDIIDYCRNDFVNTQIQLLGNTISFDVEGTISDSDEGFTDALFFDGMDIKVSGSKLNDGIYEIKTVTAGTLTLTTDITQNLITEAAENIILLTMVDFRKLSAFKIATLFKYYLAREGKLVNSESLPSGYSANFKSSKEMWKPFNQYRKPYL